MTIIYQQTEPEYDIGIIRLAIAYEGAQDGCTERFMLKFYEEDITGDFTFTEDDMLKEFSRKSQQKLAKLRNSLCKVDPDVIATFDALMLKL